MPGIQEIFVLLIIVLAVLILPRYLSRGRGTARAKLPPGRRLLDLTGRMRLAVVASVLWTLAAAVYFKPWDENALAFICFGPGPVLLAWGVGWIIKGFQRHRL